MKSICAVQSICAMSLLFAEHEKELPVSKSLCPNMQATLESTENPDDFPSPIGLRPSFESSDSACIYLCICPKITGRLFYRSAGKEVPFAYYCLVCDTSAINTCKTPIRCFVRLDGLNGFCISILPRSAI